jgi:hypothetical protein
VGFESSVVGTFVLDCFAGARVSFFFSMITSQHPQAVKFHYVLQRANHVSTT